MASIYDEEDRRNALTQGLLAAGLAALGARKGSEFNALGQAGLLGMTGYNTSLRDATNAREAQALQKMREQQFAQQQQAWQQQQAERAALQQAHQQAIIPAVPGGEAEPREGGMTPGIPGGFDSGRYVQALQNNPAIDPMKAVAYAQALAKDTPFDKPKPESWTPQSLAAYAKTRDPSVLVPVSKPQEQWREVGRTPSGQILMENSLTGEKKAVGSSPPITNVSVKNFAETEENKAIGKARGEAYMAINSGASKARAKLTSLSAIDSLVGDVETSPLTPIGVKAAGTLKGALGIDIDPNLPRKQAAETIMGRMALDARSTAEGGGMPGAMSDADREFLRGMNPSLSQTKEGRALIVKVQTRLAKRDQEMAQWAREYRAKTGQFDEGFQEYAAEKSAQSPLFADLIPQAAAPSSGGLTPAEQAELAKLRKKYGR